MTERSILWTTGGAGDSANQYSQSDAVALFNAIVGGQSKYMGVSNDGYQGVLQGVANELAVTGTSSPVAVNTGAAFVSGMFYWNDASVNVTVPTPSLGDTQHYIVLNWLASTQEVRLLLVEGIDGANRPPSTVRVPGVQWQIRVATIGITTGGVITVLDSSPSKCSFGTKISTEMLDDDSVSDIHLIAGGLTMHRRQGGSASSWAVGGSTDYTPTTIKGLAGAHTQSLSGTSGSFTITLPESFSQTAIFFVTPQKSANMSIFTARVGAPGSSSFTVYWTNNSSLSSESVTFDWVAFGAL